MKKRLLSLAMALVMLLGLMPSFTIHAHAGYEDGAECWNCGHYHWDEFMHDCGACSPDCTNDWCALETHCHNCGECLNGEQPCENCGLCEKCAKEMGHCTTCGECWMDNDPDNTLCGNCGQCYFCSPICEECGLCAECANDWDDGMHCPECRSCYQVTEQCQFLENNHCKDCCRPCDQCGDCIAGDALTYCYDCGLCVECCEFNSMMAGCEDGDICVASSEWDDHLCYDCGQFFGSLSEMCETCVASGYARCQECCAASSQCSEGMCEYDSEYEEHFCMDCGECFDDVTLCDTCAGEDEYRCETCCQTLTQSLYGCDDGYCQYDTGFEEHLKECEDAIDYDDDHTASASRTWSFDENQHWHDCWLCDEDAEPVKAEKHREEIDDAANHTFDEAGLCAVCGYVESGKVVLRNDTARTITAKVSDENAGKDDPYHISNNTITLKADVRYNKKSDQELDPVYNWYVHYQYTDALGDKYEETLLAEDFCNGKYDESDPKHSPYDLYGAERKNGAVWQEFYKPTWTFSVPYTACVVDYSFYCEIEVYEKDAKPGTEPIQTITTQPITLKAGHLYSFASSYTQVKPEDRDKGHLWLCAGCSFNDDIVYSKDWAKRSSALESHRYGPFQLVTKNGETYRQAKCLDCGYTGMTKTHTHVYYEGYTKQVDETYINHDAHKLICLKEGCDQTKLESHDWRWNVAGLPDNDPEGKGRVLRECYICGLTEDRIYSRDKNGKEITLDWTKANALVQAQNANVSKSLVENGDTLKLTIQHRGDVYQRCAGWKVTYRTWTNGTVDVTKDFTFTQTQRGVYTCKVKFAPGGGVLTFIPTMVDCDHPNGTTVVDKKDPVCDQSGYSGDKVCVDCGKVVETGKETSPIGTAHTGTLIPLYRDKNGMMTEEETKTRYNAVKGDCTHRGYEGDYRCSACNGIVKGENTGYKHGTIKIVDEVKATCTTQGYTGDEVCQSCGKLVKRGTYTGYYHDDNWEYVNEKQPTCTEMGYTGDKRCSGVESLGYCHKIFSYGRAIAALGHDWGEWNVTKPATASEDGERTRTCQREGCEGKQTVTFGYNDTEIKEVYITVPVPKTGEDQSLDYYRTAKVNKEVQEKCYAMDAHWRVAWDESDDNSEIRPNTPYMVEVDLALLGDNHFAGDAKFYINGKLADGKEETSAGVPVKTVSYTFPKSDDGPAIIYVQPTSWGEVDASARHAWPGETVRFTVTPKLGSGWHFEGWWVSWCDSEQYHDEYSYGKSYYSTNQTIDYVVPEGATDVSAWAEFKRNAENVRTLSLQATVGGTASASAYYAKKGETITLTAEADAGYRFSGWKVLTGDATISGDTLTMGEEDTAVKAIFVKTDHTHSFTRENPTAKYLKSAATCTAPAVYYQSCLCGEYGTETFTYGEALGHNMVGGKCARCGYSTGGGSAVTPPEKPDLPFTDIPKGSPYEDAIKWAAEEGITTGKTGTLFDPDGTCTRGQAVTFLWRAAGKPAPKSTAMPFTDVKPGSYCYEAVLWAVERGITKGTTETTFSPDAKCGRGHIVTFLYRVAGSPAVTAENPFQDVAEGSFCHAAVLWAVEKGITKGVTASSFAPQADCTRAQIVTFLYRAQAK